MARKSKEDRVEEIRGEAIALRQERLSRGNVRLQGAGATLSEKEVQRRKKEQPAVVKRLNKFLGADT